MADHAHLVLSCFILSKAELTQQIKSEIKSQWFTAMFTEKRHGKNFGNILLSSFSHLIPLMLFNKDFSLGVLQKFLHAH